MCNFSLSECIRVIDKDWKNLKNVTDKADSAKKDRIQSALDISNIDTSKYHCKHFNPFCLKLLISHSKFSRTRKFTLRYQ